MIGSLPFDSAQGTPSVSRGVKASGYPGKRSLGIPMAIAICRSLS